MYVDVFAGSNGVTFTFPDGVLVRIYPPGRLIEQAAQRPGITENMVRAWLNGVWRFPKYPTLSGSVTRRIPIDNIRTVYISFGINHPLNGAERKRQEAEADAWIDSYLCPGSNGG